MTSTITDSFHTIISNQRFLANRTNFAFETFKNRYIIIAGGLDEESTSLGSSKIFDIKTQDTITLPDIPMCFNADAFVNHGVIINDYFYVLLRGDEVSYPVDEKKFPTVYAIYRIQLSALEKWEIFGRHTIYTNSRINIVSNGNHLFLIGCFDFSDDFIFELSSYKACNKIIEYDLESCHFTKFSLPKNFDIYTACVVGDRIHIIGESKDKKACKAMYDIQSRSLNVYQNKKCLCKEDMMYSKPMVIERWIVFRNIKRIFGIHDTQNDFWIENEVSFSTSPEFEITGSALIGGSRLSFITRGERNKTFFIVERKQIIPNWYVWKDFILLKQLVNKNRAKVISSSGKENIVLQELITSLDNYLFMQVLLFL